MTTQYNGSRLYASPMIKRIELDNDISLQLESTPPEGPGEGALLAPEYLNNDPFKATYS
jgi:hypothetical protein